MVSISGRPNEAARRVLEIFAIIEIEVLLDGAVRRLGRLGRGFWLSWPILRRNSWRWRCRALIRSSGASLFPSL